MPLPTDQGLLTLSEDLIAQLEEIFGKHPGLRPAHARGTLVSGSFKPTPEAAALSTAPHFNNDSTPITIRFSSATGIPNIPDNDPNASPRGIGVRFNLGHRVHTDIIGQSCPAFPTRAGPEFLEFLRAVAASPPGSPSPSAIEQFLGSHPAALAFVQYPKPSPASFATEIFHSVVAYKFTNAQGVTKFGRYIISPDAGTSYVDQAELASKSPSYVYEELSERIAKGPVSFTLRVQIAEDGDVTDDSTVLWPENRPVIDLGKLTIDTVVPDNDAEQKYIILDPVPRVGGIEPSKDPLIELRAAVYLISGRRRRAA